MTRNDSSTTDIQAKETAAQCPRGGSSLSSFTNEELAGRARNGSVACFGELVDRFEGLLVGYLRRRVGATDSEDLAQETFVRAWASLSRYDPERSFSTWLFTIASRLATDHYRRKTRDRKIQERRAAEGPEARGHSEDESEGPFEAAGDIWALARGVLSEEQFAALWLRYAGELRIIDVAKALSKTQVATRVMLFRAREKLAAELSGGETPGASRAKKDVRAESTVEHPLQSTAATSGGAI